MIIFLDTNIFYNNWHLNNANFKLLFNFIENTNSKLLVSDIVCDEINNKQQILFDENISIVKNSYNKINKLLNDFSNPRDISFENNYDFKDVLESKTENVIFYKYDNILNSELVKRAIKKIKPFQSEDKGYRDTLIWLSFLDYVKTNKVTDEIIFINNNSSDFYNNSNTDFHIDLKKDLDTNEISNKFSIFKDLHSFVTVTIDKLEHSKTYEEVEQDIVYENEHLIEQELTYYINNLEITEVINLFSRDKEYYKLLRFANSFNFEITEGIEDPDLINYKILKENIFYIELNFNLRIMTMEYFIPTAIYLEHISDFSSFYNIDDSKETTKIEDYLRVDFNISFTLNTEMEEIENLVINSTKILK